MHKPIDDRNHERSQEPPECRDCSAKTLILSPETGIFVSLCPICRAKKEADPLDDPEDA